jgi:hypothetical protein
MACLASSATIPYRSASLRRNRKTIIGPHDSFDAIQKTLEYFGPSGSGSDLKGLLFVRTQYVSGHVPSAARPVDTPQQHLIERRHQNERMKGKEEIVMVHKRMNFREFRQNFPPNMRGLHIVSYGYRPSALKML